MSAIESQVQTPAWRNLYVLVYPSRLFAAHWSFFLPYDGGISGTESDTGDRIHVTGDRLNGFRYGYVREYCVSEDTRQPNKFPIGSVLVEHLKAKMEFLQDSSVVGRVDEDGNLGEMDMGPFNGFDEACRAVPAPGPSLNKTVSAPRDVKQTATAVPRRTEVKDCQWWIKQAVAHLTEVGLLCRLERHGGPETELDSPLVRVEGLPRH